jgi:hypothetical protein
MLETEQTVFIILSFEGPDVYSQAGGLGVRVKELSRALAERGYQTHLFFVGDPQLPAHESLLEGRLNLHRWSQWISRFYPMGVYSGEDDKVRRYGEFRYAAKSWTVERRVIARVEAGPQGADSRFIVTNLAGLPKSLYEKVYCARGQAENLIKAHKLHLASDRTSCTKATANQFRLLIHTAAYWLMLGLRGLAPRTSFWREAQFDTIRLCLIKVAGRVTEMVTRIKIALPTAYPYQAGFADLAGRLAKLPP